MGDQRAATGQDATTRRRHFGDVEPETLERAGITRREYDVVCNMLDVTRAMAFGLESTAVAFDMNGQTLMALRQLDAAVSQKELATSLGCDPSYVTTIVDRLEAMGAVERVTDPADRRVKRIVLTEEGRRLRIETGVHLLRDVPSLLRLEEHEIEQLAGLLGKIVDANAAVLAESYDA